MYIYDYGMFVVRERVVGGGGGKVYCSSAPCNIGWQTGSVAKVIRVTNTDAPHIFLAITVLRCSPRPLRCVAQRPIKLQRIYPLFRMTRVECEIAFALQTL